MAIKRGAPLLSAEWINARVDNVQDRLEKLFDHLIDEGLLASGYFPFEEPLTPKLEKKMLEQVEGMLMGAESEMMEP